MVEEKKTLIDPGNGLFETHITWDMIEKAMQETFNTKATLGPERTAKNLADGIGFSSVIALVEAHWQNGTAELPEKFVVKMSTCVHGKKMAQQFEGSPEGFDEEALFANWQVMNRAMHNNESDFYRFVKENAENYADFKIPTVYYIREFDSPDDVYGFLIMEFIDEIKLLHLYDDTKVENCKEALRALARIHAFTLTTGYVDKEEFKKTNCFEQCYGQMMPLAQLEYMLQMMSDASTDESYKQLVAQVKEILPEAYDIPKLMKEPETRGITPIIAHGDLWSTNVLWNASDLSLRCVIDFQLLHIGTPGEDISRFLITCMNGKERQEHEMELLEGYYADFIEFLGDFKRPFTLEQLRDNYRAVFPLSASVNAAMFGPVLQYVTSKVEDEGVKTAITDACRAKTTAMFEDLLKYHKMNL